MVDPSFHLRTGTTGEQVEGTPGNVLTFQTDGSVAGEPSASGTSLSTALLVDGDQTLTTAERYVMPPGTATLPSTVTLTPGPNGEGWLVEIGTQTEDVTIQDGGPGTPTLYTVVAGTRFAVWAASNGTNVVDEVYMPLGAEPS